VKPTHTPPRSIRVEDDLWGAAGREADRRGETRTDAIVRFLRRYTRDTPGATGHDSAPTCACPHCHGSHPGSAH
jgi:hypothetical protein